VGSRIGVYTLRKIARQLCKYVYQFTPAIRAAFPDNTALFAALEAANAACGVLDIQLALVQEEGV
jgi:hypothetical protein